MKKLTKVLLLAFVLLMLVSSVPVGAITPYKTYTYSIDGDPLISPDVYVPDRLVDSSYMGLNAPLADPRDVFVAPNKDVYIADAGANRIVVLDQYYKLKMEISTFVNENGVPDSLASPSGVFVNDEKIYIADTLKNRIVIFNVDGEFVKIIEEPSDDSFPEGSIYQPVALAVDKYGRIYVVSSTTYMGVISINEDGDFQGFIGAQKVTIGAFDKIWRKFQTEEQKKASIQYVSVEFNNIAINDAGFIYVTTSAIEESSQAAAITSKDGTYSPVKMLNTSGKDIMKRKGFFGPGGEVGFTNISTAEITGPSKIIDVAVGPEKTWSIIDEKRSKVYTYDEDGNILFIFGDTGTQLGNIASIEAIAYQGDKILLLDKSSLAITVYRRTEYGDILLAAVKNTNDREYDLTMDRWSEVLKRNNNYDPAYIGIGNSLYRTNDYEESLSYFKAAYETENYSKSFKEIRKAWISKNILLIPLGAIAIVVLLLLWGKYAKKLNTKTQLKKGRKTFWEELVYAHHVIFHPFDGFWDLKHEQRGSVRASFVWLGITVLAFFYQDVGTGYIFNPRDNHSNILIQLVSVVVPVMLWVIGNWCLTTLFEGEGSLKDIFIATCYALVPLPIVVIPTTIATNFACEDEQSLISLVLSIGFIWCGLLIVLGSMTTHDYTFGKNIIICICTIIAMAFIMFIAILFSTLVAKIVSFFVSIYTELTYRM